MWETITDIAAWAIGIVCVFVVYGLVSQWRADEKYKRQRRLHGSRRWW